MFLGLVEMGLRVVWCEGWFLRVEKLGIMMEVGIY